MLGRIGIILVIISMTATISFCAEETDSEKVLKNYQILKQGVIKERENNKKLGEENNVLKAEIKAAREILTQKNKTLSDLLKSMAADKKITAITEKNTLEEIIKLNDELHKSIMEMKKTKDTAVNTEKSPQNQEVNIAAEEKLEIVTNADNTDLKDKN